MNERKIPTRIEQNAAWIVAHRLDLRTPAAKQLVSLIEEELVAEAWRAAKAERDACEKVARDRADQLFEEVFSNSITTARALKAEESLKIADLIAKRSS